MGNVPILLFKTGVAWHSSTIAPSQDPKTRVRSGGRIHNGSWVCMGFINKRFYKLSPGATCQTAILIPLCGVLGKSPNRYLNRGVPRCNCRFPKHAFENPYVLIPLCLLLRHLKTMHLHIYCDSTICCAGAEWTSRDTEVILSPSFRSSNNATMQLHGNRR